MEQLPKIVQRGLRKAHRPEIHPDPDLLAAFAEKSLTDRERVSVLEHLAECGDCREIISLAMPEIESAHSANLEKSRWLSWPVLRWGALAVCVVVVSAAVTLHYERRQTAEPTFTDRIPEASTTLTAESKESNEKLAAKIAPSSPFPSDRDSGTAAGKLARQKQLEKTTNAEAISSAQALDQRLDQNQNKETEAANDRPKSAFEYRSADKPAPAAGAIVAAVPSAPVPARVPAPESQTKAASGQAVSIGGVTETVTVDSATAGLERSVQPAEQKAKDETAKNQSQRQNELQLQVQREEAQSAGAGAQGSGSLADRKMDSRSVETTAAATPAQYAKRSLAGNKKTSARWSLSADGMVQRSLDSGKIWQTIPVARGTVFRALAANDSDIWVGGAAGALYHSFDAGEHWTQVKPVADGDPLTADILTVEFSNPQHGKLITSNNETWTTSDAGASWQKR